MDVNSIVIVSLISPKEKMWGQILGLETRGVTLRGIELDSFDDFLRQVVHQEDTAVGLNTVFFPMHRVEQQYVKMKLKRRRTQPLIAGKSWVSKRKPISFALP